MGHCFWDGASSQFTKSFHPLVPRDIFTGTKGAGKHLRLMQIRSRCFRSAHSGLRSRTVSYLSLCLFLCRPPRPTDPPVLSLATFHLRGLLAQVVSCGGLRCCLTSSLTSHTTKHRERLVCALSASIKIFLSFSREKNKRAYVKNIWHFSDGDKIITAKSWFIRNLQKNIIYNNNKRN